MMQIDQPIDQNLPHASAKIGLVIQIICYQVLTTLHLQHELQIFLEVFLLALFWMLRTV